MSIKEYYQKGQNFGLPNRCPILEYCERHALSVYFLSNFKEIDHENNYVKALQKEGEVPKDFNEKKINLKGEPPVISKGKGHGMFENMCPEVNLFDGQNSFDFAYGKPYSGMVWDKEKSDFVKIHSAEEKHYTECLEFSSYSFEVRNEKGKNRTKEPCYTYLMFDHKSGLCKIGGSKDPVYREKTLQVEQPEVETIAQKKFNERKSAI